MPQDETNAPATISVGGHLWMTEDLAVTVTRDGTPLLRADTAEAWKEALDKGLPAWRPSGSPHTGHLYNLRACKLVAPEGWRVAWEEAWLALAAAAKEQPEAVAALGFRARRGLAWFDDHSPTDRELGAYWYGHLTMDESWGTPIGAAGVEYFAGFTMYGADCPYGLFIRCVKDTLSTE